MTRFLISVWPFPGHYFPLIAIARELRARGHEVAFYTGASARADIEAEGMPCFTFNAIDEQQFAALMVERETWASGRRPRQMKALLRRWLLDTLPGQVADLSGLLEHWRPDMIITETAMWGPTLVLHETHAMPVAVFSTVAACMLPGPDAPPFGLGLPPPRRWHTRLLARGVALVGEWFAADFRQAANDLRRRYSLSPLSVSMTERCGQMALYLMPSDPAFDYERRDLPPTVKYVGPCIWHRSNKASAPAWLEALPHDRPWVHVSEGTVNSQQPLVLRAAAQGLAALPLHVIMTTGGNRDPERLDLGMRAENIHVVRWVPHENLLPQVDVLVTTGGAGTVMAALQAGVPLVVVPTEWDKPENARRIEAIGAGVRLHPRRCTPALLRAAVEHVLNEPAYRRQARHMQAVLAKHNGPARSAELLEAIPLQRSSPQHWIHDPWQES